MYQRILVEGDDIHLIVHLCLKKGITGVVGYKTEDDFKNHFRVNKKETTGGKEAVLKLLKANLKNPEIKTLGIILDSDDSAVSTWQSVKAILENPEIGYKNLRPELPVEGVLIEKQPELPRIGVWIMPDNQNPGAIEDFFKELLDPKDLLMKRAKKVVGEIKTAGENRFSDSPKYQSKAEVHSWLAWQERPGIPMGLALKSNLATHENPLADRFLNWFEQVFDLEKPPQSTIPNPQSPIQK